MATVTPSPARAWRVWSWKEATDWPWSGTATARLSRVEMRSWWSTKSKSMAKTGLPSTWPMGRVVMPRPVRCKGTFHQWLRRTLAASRIFPTTWQNRCSVCVLSCEAASGIGGNSSMPSTLRLRGDVAGRLDGMLGAPGVHAALERLDALEAELAELQRRPGAGLFPRSGAVQDIGLVAEAVGRPLGDLVGQDPDAAGNADAVALVLRAAAHIQDHRRVRPGQAFGQLGRGDPGDVVGAGGEQLGGGAGAFLGQGLLARLAGVPAGERGGGDPVGDHRHQHHHPDEGEQRLAAGHALTDHQQGEQQAGEAAGPEPADELAGIAAQTRPTQPPHPPDDQPPGDENGQGGPGTGRP